jgi:hypothetical protein
MKNFLCSWGNIQRASGVFKPISSNKLTSNSQGTYRQIHQTLEGGGRLTNRKSSSRKREEFY